MHFIQPKDHARRAFLRRSTQLALTGAALPTAINLAAMGEAAAFNATNYKALVCIFLNGGNDHWNTVVPYDNTNYDLYSAIRGGGAGRTAGGIALAQSALASTVLAPSSSFADGRQFALHPSMTGLANLFNAGQAAVQLNVGPLVVPVTKTQYLGANRALYPLPPKLFSHNDQQSIWQSSSPEGSTIGWGGNIGDLALASNGGNSLFTCISVTGNAVFLSGDQALAYQVSPNGAVKIDCVSNNVYGSSAVKTAMRDLIQQARSDALEDSYNRVTQRSIAAESSINGGIGSGPATGSGPEFASFASLPNNNTLAAQLKMVARLIAAKTSLSTKRQVFFVSVGGFDLHDNLIANHIVNMQRLSDAMTAFYQTTVNLGVASSVTAFTASDFGRTLTSNGDGSDHGWGGHHFIVGGAVKGKAFYGTPPPVSVGSGAAAEDQWHVGQGRLLPSTSVDQYAATLASWFGVEATELNGILPNLRNFGAPSAVDYPINMGFLA
jgi:uncharacterized protein (DUF1501 family)